MVIDCFRCTSACSTSASLLVRYPVVDSDVIGQCFSPLKQSKTVIDNRQTADVAIGTSRPVVSAWYNPYKLIRNKANIYCMIYSLQSTIFKYLHSIQSGIAARLTSTFPKLSMLRKFFHISNFARLNNEMSLIFLYFK